LSNNPGLIKTNLNTVVKTSYKSVNPDSILGDYTGSTKIKRTRFFLYLHIKIKDTFVFKWRLFN